MILALVQRDSAEGKFLTFGYSAAVEAFDDRI